MATDDKLESLIEKYALNKTWLASELNYTRQNFYKAQLRGFSAAEKRRIESVLRSMGRELAEFSFD